MQIPTRAKVTPPARAAGAESIQNARDDGLAPKTFSKNSPRVVGLATGAKEAQGNRLRAEVRSNERQYARMRARVGVQRGACDV